MIISLMLVVLNSCLRHIKLSLMQGVKHLHIRGFGWSWKGDQEFIIWGGEG
jgi:hypothetical protein